MSLEHLPEGCLAPDFELATVAGEPMKLSDRVSPGPLAVIFYKGSCPTCQMTFPFVQKIFEGLETGSEPAIWAISQDSVSETASFVAEYELTFPVLIDEHPYSVSDAYALQFVPTAYLIGADRKIEVAGFGFSKPTLTSIATGIARANGCPVPRLFSEGDGLPDWRPG